MDHAHPSHALLDLAQAARTPAPGPTRAGGHAAAALPVGGTTLLLIEPSGGPAGPMLAALARAQGQALERQVLGSTPDAHGGRGTVVLEQVAAPLAQPGPQRVACLRTPQVDGLMRAHAVRDTLASAGLVVVWAGDLSQARLAAWVVGAAALARQHHAAAGAPVPWLVFQPFAPRPPGPDDPPTPAWLAAVRLLPALPAPGAIRAAWLWQQVLGHWITR